MNEVTILDIDIYSTCLWEEVAATGQIGHFQSWTDKVANVTANIAWIVETILLQKSNERFGKIFLTTRKVVAHEKTPTTINFLMYSSISLWYELKKKISN